MRRDPPPFALLPPGIEPLRPVPASELEAALEAAILAGADGRLSRGVECFMAGVCASVLAERVLAAGLVVARPMDDRYALENTNPQ